MSLGCILEINGKLPTYMLTAAQKHQFLALLDPDVQMKESVPLAWATAGSYPLSQHHLHQQQHERGGRVL